MRDTDGLQATISCSVVNVIPRKRSPALPVTDNVLAHAAPKTSISPTRSRPTFIRRVSELQASRLFRALIEKADQELVLQQRHGQRRCWASSGGEHVLSPSRRTFGEVVCSAVVEPSTSRRPTQSRCRRRVAWDTSHQLMITQTLRDAVCDQMSDQSAGKSRVDVCQDAGDADLLGRSRRPSTLCIRRANHWSPRNAASARAILSRRVRGSVGDAYSPAVVDPDEVTGLAERTTRRLTTRRTLRRNGSRPRRSGSRWASQDGSRRSSMAKDEPRTVGRGVRDRRTR